MILYISIKNLQMQWMEGKHALVVMCQFVFSVAGILNFHQRREGARQAEEEEGDQSDENKGREKRQRERRRLFIGM